MSSLQEKFCCETKFPPKKNSTEKKDPETSSFTKSPMAQKESQLHTGKYMRTQSSALLLKWIW